MNLTDAIIVTLVLLLVLFIISKTVKRRLKNNESGITKCNSCPGKKYCNRSKK